MQIALQVSQVQAFRASYSVSALSSQVHSAQVHRVIVSMFSCFPSDRPTPALYLSPRTLVDPLLCYPSEVLQLRFVYIKYGRTSLARRDTPPRSMSSDRDNKRYVNPKSRNMLVKIATGKIKMFSVLHGASREFKTRVRITKASPKKASQSISPWDPPCSLAPGTGMFPRWNVLSIPRFTSVLVSSSQSPSRWRIR